MVNKRNLENSFKKHSRNFSKNFQTFIKNHLQTLEKVI